MTSSKLAVARLFACDALLGRPPALIYEQEPTLADMMARFERFPIARALVRGMPGLYTDTSLANATLLENLAGQDAFEGVWMVTPDDAAPQIEAMAAAGMRSVWMKGDTNYIHFPLYPWCCGELFDILQEKRIPLLLSWRMIDPNELHEAMKAFPKMRVIILDGARLGRQVMVEALLKTHPELYFCFSTSFSLHGGYPELCKRYGIHRWVWGCGYPDSEEGASVTGLFYSGIGQEALEAVAHGNIERLLSEVQI